MPTFNPYDQYQNPWKHSKWNQQYGGGDYQACHKNPYDFCQNPWLYSKFEQRHGGGCYTPCKPRRRRRRNRCGYGY